MSAGAGDGGSEARSALSGRSRGGWGLALILVYYLLLAGAAGRIIRLDYGPDEWQHLQYIHVLATEFRLPNADDTHLAVHPPLYYLAMALPWKLAGVEQAPAALPHGAGALAVTSVEGRSARLIIRLLTAGLGCLVLLILWRMLAIVGVSGVARTVMTFGVASWPMFQYLGGVANNELLAVLHSALVAAAVARLIVQSDCGVRQAALLGLLIGLGAWAKQTALFSAPIAFWAVVVHGEPRARLSRAVAFLAAAGAVGVWWPWRVYAMTGSFNPCLIPPYDQPTPHDLLTRRGLVADWAATIVQTFVLPDWSWSFVPPILSRVTGLAGAAAVLLLWVTGLGQGERRERALRGCGFAGAALLLLGVLQYTAFTDWRANIGGRYLLSGIPWLLLLIAGSLPRWRRLGRYLPGLLPALAMTLMVLIAAAWWLLASDSYASITL